MSLEFDKVLVASTAHVPTDVYLDNGDTRLLRTSYEFGWFVYLDMDILAEWAPAIAPIAEFAKEQGCNWIRFDRDGPFIKGFKVWEW